MSEYTAEEVKAMSERMEDGTRIVPCESDCLRAAEALRAYAATLRQPADSGRVDANCMDVLRRLRDMLPTVGICGWPAGVSALDEAISTLAAQGQGEVAEWQFQGRDGEWRSFTNDRHRFNTERDGTWPIRALYTRPAATEPPSSPAGVPDVVSEVMAELEKAIRKFPTWPTDPLHAVGVFNEEAGELSKAVLQQVYEPHKNAADDVRKEARQAAAMALRFLVSIDSYDWTPGTQHEQPSLAATPITIIQDGEVSAADFAAAMRSCGLSLKTFAEVDREARRVAKERAAAPSAPEGDGGEG